MADYTPLTEERFKELKKLVQQDIKDWIPENLMGVIWGFRNEVKGSTDRQPCSCQSAGALWKSAVDDLRKWVSEKENG
jgi:hypothetical protein